MRICALNSDNFGDVLLRQPLYQALLDAGHDLAIVLQGSFAEFMRSVIPGAVVIPFDLNAYDYPALSRGDYALEIEGLGARVREFAPDCHVVARFHWTLFDELILEQSPNVPILGFNGYLFPCYPWVLHNGEPVFSRIRFERQASVTEEEPEHLKNQELARLILGPGVSLSPAAVRLNQQDLQLAKDYLRDMGLRAGAYWVICAGESAPHISVRNWPLDHWAKALSEVIGRYGYPILFTGTPKESESVEAIRSKMGAISANTHNLCLEGRSLSFLAGLIHFSRAYIGRDTGPMHLAAALGKPVIAVFGSGTWPRFIPTAGIGAVIGIQTPCGGCKWNCHLPVSHCIKDVPLESVLKAIDDLENGLLTSFEVRAPLAEPGLLASMLRESRTAAQAERKANVQERTRLGYDLAGMASTVELLEADLSCSRGKLDTAESNLKESNAKLSEVQAHLQHSEECLAASGQHVGTLQAELAAIRIEKESMEKDLVAMSHRMADTESDLKLARSQLQETAANLEAAAHRGHRLEAALRDSFVESAMRASLLIDAKLKLHGCAAGPKSDRKSSSANGGGAHGTDR